MAQKNHNTATTVFGWPVVLPPLIGHIIPQWQKTQQRRPSKVAGYVLGHLLNWYTSGYD